MNKIKQMHSGMKHMLIPLFLLLLTGCGVSAPGSAAECAAGTRYLQEDRLATGTACLPDQIDRIVALDPFTFEAMIALNAPMVGAPKQYVNELLTHVPQLEPVMEALTDTGIPVNFETLVELEPDVILCRRTACERNLRRLNQIAPTILFDNTSAADWRESARFYAEMIGMEAELDAVETAYDSRTQMIREALGEQAPTISVMRVQPSRLRLYFEQSFSGIVLTDAGFIYPETQADQADANRDDLGRPQLANISEERLALLEADYAFVYATENLGENDAQAYLEELQNQALWQSLDVVQRDDLHLVGTYWFASGYIAAHEMLDDLSLIVLGVDGSTDNPFK